MWKKFGMSPHWGSYWWILPRWRAAGPTRHLKPIPGVRLAMCWLCCRLWGRKTAFIGKVGADYFGGMLHSALEELGISAEGLLHDRTYNTTLAFVHNDTAGERSFSFYRKPGADSMLRSQEVPFSLIEQSRIFHFGTLSMTRRARSRSHP